MPWYILLGSKRIRIAQLMITRSPFRMSALWLGSKADGVDFVLRCRYRELRVRFSLGSGSEKYVPEVPFSLVAVVSGLTEKEGPRDRLGTAGGFSSAGVINGVGASVFLLLRHTLPVPFQTNLATSRHSFTTTDPHHLKSMKTARTNRSGRIVRMCIQASKHARAPNPRIPSNFGGKNKKLTRRSYFIFDDS
jgi:hypothetical protein